MAEILADGSYTIEVELNGGSGRAYISSPANLIVSNGNMKAEIEWSSPNYDYMKIGNVEYYTVNSEGNSRFMIDIEDLDSEIPILAETVAMSQPHMIEYTLYFDSSTVKSKNSSASGIVFGATASAIILTVLAAISVKLIKRKKTNEKN